MRTKIQGPELESEFNFKGQCSDLKGCIFDVGPRASEKNYITVKETERCLGAAYSDSCQPSIMTETLEIFPDPEVPTIIPGMVIDHPKTDAEITYPKKKNIEEVIHQKLRKKDV